MLEILTKNAELARIAERVRWGIAGEAEVKSVSAEDFLSIRTDPGEVHVRSSIGLAIPSIEEKSNTQQDPRTRRFIASDETADRYGDIIRVAGWDFANFKKNPVALWAHDDHEPPIGVVTDMTLGEVKGKPALLESIRYFAADVNPLSESVLRLIDAGGIRAVSVGFIPHKYSQPVSAEERMAAGLGPYGVEFTKVEQVELSNCSIPANPNALLSKALVPMVRDMEASGQLSAALARSFYAAASRLEASERRVFALGAPGESGEAKAAPAAPSPVVVEAKVLTTQTKVSPELVAPAIPHEPEEPEQESVPAPTLEQRLAVLEEAHATLRAEHDQTRAHLAASVKTLEGLMQFLESNETSSPADQTSGQGNAKNADVREAESEKYLSLVFAESFRAAVNR